MKAARIKAESARLESRGPIKRGTRMARPNVETHRSARTERSDIEYPLWRKKVDNSIFRSKGTTVPMWACRMWELTCPPEMSPFRG